MRQRLFNVRFSDDEWDRLTRISEFYGITAAEAIRMMMKDRERELAKAVHKVKR